MKTKFTYLFITLALLARVHQVAAQGTAFTYQGLLSDGGSPVSGSYDLTFTLYASNTTGVLIAGPITNSATVVSNGLFTVLIDFGTGIFTGTNYWLGIGVQTNGESGFTPLAPRQPLTPAPYAIYAENANSLSGLLVQQNTNGIPNLIGGSPGNFVSSGVVGATIGGGGALIYDGSAFTNSVTADFGTVGGGLGNTASGSAGSSTVGGGLGNTASDYAATVAGGMQNTASITYATIGGGVLNINSGFAATVGGGYQNTASGAEATVPGGYNNVASGYCSFAAGADANAIGTGTFVWNDNKNAAFSSTTNGQFAVHADGGVLLAANVQIGTGNTDYRSLQMGGGNSYGFIYGSYPKFKDFISMGYNYYADGIGNDHIINSGGGSSRVSVGYGEVVLAVGGVDAQPTTERLDATTAGVTVYGTFNNSSDRNAKQDFAPVSPSQILAKVLQLPVSEWSYKTDVVTRHIGPMGQDFYATFNIGTDEKHIAPIDEGGVAFAAIQGLNQKLNEKDAEIQNLEKKLDDLQAVVKKLVAQK
jgi:hypothetical protein